MLKIFYITAFTLLLASGIFMVACTKDPGIPETAVAPKHNNINTVVADCNKPGGNYAEKKIRGIVHWGGRYGNRYSKTTDISVYNTDNELRLLVNSTKYIADVKLSFQGEEQPLSLKDTPGFFHRSLEKSFLLPPNWHVNDTIHLELLVEGPGPEATFALEYVIRGNCD